MPTFEKEARRLLRPYIIRFWGSVIVLLILLVAFLSSKHPTTLAIGGAILFCFMVMMHFYNAWRSYETDLYYKDWTSHFKKKNESTTEKK